LSNAESEWLSNEVCNGRPSPDKVDGYFFAASPGVFERTHMKENKFAGQQFNLPDLLEKLKLQHAAEDVRMGKTLAVFDAVSKLTGAKQVGTSVRTHGDSAFVELWPADETHTLARSVRKLEPVDLKAVFVNE
jgi:hypothetical protein